MENCMGPSQPSLMSQWREQAPAGNHFCSTTQFFTSRQSHSVEAVSLKRAWFVIRIYCQGEKVPSPTQMPGSGWCQMVTGPSFSATVIALCKGGKMPAQLLGKQPAASEGSELWGISDWDGWKKKNFTTWSRHLPEVLVREIVERHCLFLLCRCNSNAGDIRAEPLQRGQCLKLSIL